MKYDYEVGATPDDNNNTRLPGTCNPEAQRGDSAYHHLEMAGSANVSVSGPKGLVETTASEQNLSAKYKYHG